MNQQEPALRCTQITKTFVLDRRAGTELSVLRGIDFAVGEGEFVSIVGASGSGKSTLLHILGGLETPTSGSVFWGDADISAVSDEKLAPLRSATIGFVFQFHHLLNEFTALENVMLPLLIANKSFGAASAAARDLLNKVGLGDRTAHKPAELSGGEQQRVAVARALANRPKIIFADEPSGNLDSASSAQLHDLLLALNRDEGQTFVIVTHNETFAGQSTRRLTMRDGLLA
ncbi:MAG TPA: ABC transporter ATP-binding protein [Bacteroidota bacterium]|nr:ABC transporter ATP-binding protein [Bacteroidota bacterium]